MLFAKVSISLRFAAFFRLSLSLSIEKRLTMNYRPDFRRSAFLKKTNPTQMNAVQWFEIPAQDLERAYTFYHTILHGNVRKGTFGNGDLILFNVPFNTGEAVGGAIVKRPDLIPTTDGGVIYLNAFGKLSDAVNKVELAGGKVFSPEINLGTFGFSAVIMDSEGNKIGLLSLEA
jgi:uncharacterized protein